MSSPASSGETRTRSRTSGNISTVAPIGDADRSPWPRSPASTPPSGTSRPRPPACRSISFSAGASRTGVLCYSHAQGGDISETVDAVGELKEKGFQRDPCADRNTRPAECLRRRHLLARRRMPRRMRCRARKAGRRPAISTPCRRSSRALRETFGFDLHLLHDTHHRLTPDRGGAARQGARTLPPVLARGRGCGRIAGGLSHRPPAHGDAARRRRGLQHDLGHEDAHRGAAYRLYPRDRSCMRAASRTCAASPISRRSTRSAPAFTVPMDMSPICLGACLHLDLALAEFRHPGIFRLHRRDPRRVPARLVAAPTAICIPATPPGTASTSTRNSPANSPTSAPICR